MQDRKITNIQVDGIIEEEALSFVQNHDRKVFHIDVGVLNQEEPIIFLNEYKKELTE